jgi:hypothetical protein
MAAPAEFRRALAFVSPALIAVSLMAAHPLAAGAASPQPGILAVKGVGTLYAGSGEPVGTSSAQARGVKAGGTAKFSLEVVNVGTGAATYSLQLNEDTSTAPFVQRLLAGSTDVTAAALSAPGVRTNTLAPNQKQLFTLEIVAPHGTTTGDYASDGLILYDSGGTVLVGAGAEADVAAVSKGTDHDTFVKASGEPLMTAEPSPGNTAISGPTVKVTGKTTYSVKLTNDSTHPTRLSMQLRHDVIPGCTMFTDTAHVGTTDITPAAFGPNGFIEPLAPGASSTILVTVTNISAASAACFTDTDFLSVVVSDVSNPGAASRIALLTDVV